MLQSLSHVNCVPLLGHSIQQSSSAAGRTYEVLLVFPAYQVCMVVLCVTMGCQAYVSSTPAGQHVRTSNLVLVVNLSYSHAASPTHHVRTCACATAVTAGWYPPG